MSLLQHALTTTGRLSAYLDDSNISTGTLEAIINAATEWIEGYCGRRFKLTTYTEELINSDGSEYLFLKNYPVDEDTGVDLDYRTSNENEDEWDDIDTEDRWIDWDTGVITGIGQTKWLKGVNKYRATYKAGYDFDNVTTYLSDVSGAADLEIACWKLCAAFYNFYPKAHIAEEKIGMYSVKFSKMAFEDDKTIMLILERYKKHDSTLGTMGPVLY